MSFVRHVETALACDSCGEYWKVDGQIYFTEQDRYPSSQRRAHAQREGWMHVPRVTQPNGIIVKGQDYCPKPDCQQQANTNQTKD